MEKEEMNKKMSSMEEKDMEMEDMETEGEDEELDEYEVRCAADTLLRAEEIKKDKKLFKAALESLKEKRSAINSIADLRKKAFGSDEESTPESKMKDK